MRGLELGDDMAKITRQVSNSWWYRELVRVVEVLERVEGGLLVQL